MGSESLPKEFEKATEVLPIVTYGISTIEDLRKAEAEIHLLEKLRRAGLSAEEVKLYRENEAGVKDKWSKVESSVLKQRLETIYTRISDYENSLIEQENSDQPGTSTPTSQDIFERLRDKPITIYPHPQHPMNNLKEIENNLFGLTNDIVPLTKRRKALRRFERNKDKVLQDRGVHVPANPIQSVPRPGSLWDVKEIPKITNDNQVVPTMGPAVEKKSVMYTIRNNRIVRLEPLPGDQGVRVEEYKAVEIVVPVNSAERQLLEGTKMSLDDIRKIDRFKNYEPGIPSKVLYLKNLASTVTREQLGLLFNQFSLANGGPVDVRLMAGRMRGQAFASFSSEELAVQALGEINGTIMGGRPIVAEFGRNNNTNRENAYVETMSDSSQDDDNNGNR